MFHFSGFIFILKKKTTQMCMILFQHWNSSVTMRTGFTYLYSQAGVLDMWHTFVWMFKLMHSLAHLYTAPLTLSRVVPCPNRKHTGPMCSSVLTPCIVELQTLRIFSLAWVHATSEETRQEHKKGHASCQEECCSSPGCDTKCLRGPLWIWSRGLFLPQTERSLSLCLRVSSAPLSQHVSM